MACPKGDLFCRECAVENLLSQRTEIKRLEREWERRKVEEEELEKVEEEEVRKRVVKEFERAQLGVDERNWRNEGDGNGSKDSADGSKRGSKRKFEIDEDEMLRIAREERQKARRDLENERKVGKKHSSFWVPTETPELEKKEKQDRRPPKLSPLCPSSEEARPHNYSLKTLTTVHFTEEQGEGKDTVWSCPACRKALSNATKGMLCVPCGHVLCKSCAVKFMTPVSTPDPHNPGAEHGVLRCYVCNTDLTDRTGEKGELNGEVNGEKHHKKKHKKDKDKEGVKPGVVEIRCDGTGFAGGGKNVVEKEGIAFQC